MHTHTKMKHARINAHTNTQTHTRTHTHMYTHNDTCTHIHTLTHTMTHMHARTRITCTHNCLIEQLTCFMARGIDTAWVARILCTVSQF